MEPVPIPPRALCSFFEDLAEAACFMAHGHDPLDPASLPREDRQTVIHRDLKPENIFLGLPRTPGKRGIPELKVGDFGLAIPHDYDKNPHDMVGVGTENWRAPEQHKNAIKHKLSSASDIWALGRIMLALLELLTPEPVYYSKLYNCQVKQAQGKHGRLKFYGEKLYGLIESCLRPLPNDRITASDLLKSIREHLDGEDGGRLTWLEEDDSLQYAVDMEWA